MRITANDVAALAILGGIGGVVLTNLNQRSLIRDKYLRDHRTATYLRLLQAVHVREVRAEEAWSLTQGKPSALPAGDPSLGIERKLTANLLAFASQEVYDSFTILDNHTEDLAKVLGSLRAQHGMAPQEIPGAWSRPEAAAADASWKAAREDLVSLVRSELQFRPARWWRPLKRRRASKAARQFSVQSANDELSASGTGAASPD
jgi:hypothetical protein